MGVEHQFIILAFEVERREPFVVINSFQRQEPSPTLIIIDVSVWNDQSTCSLIVLLTLATIRCVVVLVCDCFGTLIVSH
jgi:hypothetical protein